MTNNKKGFAIIFRLKCNSCGKRFVLGEDTVITSPVIPAEGALARQNNPDLVAPGDWNKLSDSQSKAQLNLIGALIASKILAEKMSGGSWNRQWSCYYCKKTQTYKLYSDDWKHDIK